MSNVFQGTGSVGDTPCLTTVLVGSEERPVAELRVFFDGDRRETARVASERRPSVLQPGAAGRGALLGAPRGHRGRAPGMSDSNLAVGAAAAPACFPSTEEIRMLRSIVRLALAEALRHGSYAASFHGFRVEARRNSSPRGSTALAEVCLSVRLGEALVARFRVLANHAQGMEPKS